VEFYTPQDVTKIGLRATEAEKVEYVKSPRVRARDVAMANLDSLPLRRVFPGIAVIKAQQAVAPAEPELPVATPRASKEMPPETVKMLARRISVKLDSDNKKMIKRRSTIGDTPRSNFSIVPPSLEGFEEEEVELEPFPLRRLSQPTSARASKMRLAHSGQEPVFVPTSNHKRATVEREANDPNSKYISPGGDFSLSSATEQDFSGVKAGDGRRMSWPWAHQPT
jgi:hypothetical protein